MNKGLGSLTGLLIAIVVATVCLQGLYAFYDDLFTTYQSENLNNTYPTEMLNFSKSIQQNISGTQDSLQKKVPIIGDVWTLGANAWSAAAMFFNMPGTLMAVFSSSVTAGAEGGIVFPGWLSILVNIIIWSILIYAIFKIAFGREV